MKKHTSIFVSLLLATLFAACGNHKNDELQKTITMFVEKYYNWRYPECVELVTPESESTLRFLASNVTEEDIELLRNAEDGATLGDIKDIKNLNDTTVTVEIEVKNYYMPDSVSRMAKLYKEGVAVLLLKKQGDVWKVNLAGEMLRKAFPQQSEKLNRD